MAKGARRKVPRSYSVPALEAYYGRALPRAYREFIAKKQYKRYDAKRFPLPGFHETGALVRFLAPDGGLEVPTLLDDAGDYDRRAARDLIPFAAIYSSEDSDAPSSEFLLIDARKPECPVSMYDHESEKFRRLASSLEAFLGKQITEEGTPPKKLKKVRFTDDSVYSTTSVLLTLGNRGLKTLTPEIGLFTRLKTLHLDHNQLTKLPAEMGNLAALQELKLHDNLGLTALPEELARCTRLSRLDIWNTKIGHVPPIPKLTGLHADSLPMIDLGSVCALRSLTFLSISKCGLRDLPATLSNLKKLKWLYIQNNDMEHLPEVLFEMKSLVSIMLDRNKIPKAEIAKLDQALPRCAIV